MSLAALAWGYLQVEGSKYHELMKLITYTARYGHQSIEVLKRMPITQLLIFSRQLGVLLTEERNSVTGGLMNND